MAENEIRRREDGTAILTRDEIMAARVNGGWSDEALKLWGVWPPKKGWISRLTAPDRFLTHEEIEAGRTAAGGWTKQTLADWGVAWPPPTGWRQRLMGVATPTAKAPSRRARVVRWVEPRRAPADDLVLIDYDD